MIKNYLKVALRSLIKQKAYSAINIIGLAIGVASCLLIVLFVTDEFSYDNFHTKADRIYKFTLERIYPNHRTNYAVVPHSFGVVMPKDFAEVEAVTRVQGPNNNVIVNYTDANGVLTQFEEQNVLGVENNFFRTFSFKLIKGDTNKVFKNNTDIVITQETAKRYFGNEDPIGKRLQVFGQDFSVTGVAEDVPENSHLDFDFLYYWSDEGQPRENFTSFSVHTYLLLKPGADYKALEAKFPGMVDRYAAAQIERDLGKSWADYKKEGNGYRYFLQPLTSIHLDPTNIEYKLKPVGGNLNQVYFLIAVAALIVAIACINFMNLATARSAERAREVGVRKTMGSAKAQLVYQFLTESLIISLVATILAIIIVEVALPGFNNLSNKHLTLEFNPMIVGGLLALACLVGLLAGSYPAFVLSGFNPVVVMKGTFSSNKKGGAWLRNGLVVFQFFISIVLMVGTLVVSDQMRFMQNKELGYDKEQLLVVERAFLLRDRFETFKEEVKKIPGVQSAAATSSKLGDEGDMFGAQFQAEGSSEILTTKNMSIDDDFAETIGFEFVKGHGYSKATNDSLSIILNETAVKTMGLGEDPVGQRLTHRIQDQNNRTVVFTIIGVIKDFNFQSLRDKITPLTITSTESPIGFSQYVYMKLNTNQYPAVLAQAETKWKELIGLSRQPGEPAEMPFKYQFLEDNLIAAYEAEQRAGTLFGIFSTLAIIIACVGLFGLAAYTANLRTKEIGIRKVMGATVGSVILLLTKEFTKLIFIAFVLAVPLSWYIMSSWLDGFAFRTSLGADTFLIAGATALAISWLTVSYQSVKAAIKNPVKSLKNE